MDDSHGKEINLMKTTVKIPGARPRGSMPTPQPKTNPNHNGEMNNLSGPGKARNEKLAQDKSGKKSFKI